MLLGVDVASYQSDLIAAKSPIYHAQDFVIIKISEGVTYRNNAAKTWAQDVYKSGRLLGFYHYARAEKNVAATEARFFVNTLSEMRPNPDAPVLLALDFEADAFRTASPCKWALDFLLEVERLTGVKPLLYISATYCAQFRQVANADFGLWVAQWGVKKPSVAAWKFWAIWQYGVLNRPGLDLNVFNGDRAAWLRYSGVSLA